MQINNEQQAARKEMQMILFRSKEITEMQTKVELVIQATDRLSQKIQDKLTVDTFEASLSQKANKQQVDQLQQYTQQLHSQFKNVVVLLNESLRLHSCKADETLVSKQNRVVILMS